MHLIVRQRGQEIGSAFFKIEAALVEPVPQSYCSALKQRLSSLFGSLNKNLEIKVMYD